MKLTTKGQYAIQAMIDIASHCIKSKVPISLREVACNQNIPLPFLEQIAIKLRRAGLIKSTRGPQGGYLLLKDKASISLADILQAVEGPINLAPTGSNEAVVTYELWQKLNGSIFKILKSITLEDLYYDSISFKASKENQAYVQ
ncbi:MAG: Rrf2 family transcriptional regulator [Candidatus Melainabacteria bacterium]|nr:Rrf2 family transcriptional regulator [Candidatus Melainabacteria bacterium]